SDVCSSDLDEDTRHRTPDRYVPLSRTHRHVVAPDRADVRRPRSHDGHVRGQEDPQRNGRAQADLRPGPGTDLSNQTARTLTSAEHPPQRRGHTCHRVAPSAHRQYVVIPSSTPGLLTRTGGPRSAATFPHPPENLGITAPKSGDRTGDNSGQLWTQLGEQQTIHRRPDLSTELSA